MTGVATKHANNDVIEELDEFVAPMDRAKLLRKIGAAIAVLIAG